MSLSLAASVARDKPR